MENKIETKTRLNRNGELRQNHMGGCRDAVHKIIEKPALFHCLIQNLKN